MSTAPDLVPAATPLAARPAVARAWARRHVTALRAALSTLEDAAPQLDRLATAAVEVFTGGGRLLAAGNGGSAAEAQHLTAELVGRFLRDRPPVSAIALTVETSSLTAIGNDFCADEVFARQVRAHGRPGDLLVLLSTSGTSTNVLAAAEAGRQAGLQVWALTGPRPNPLAEVADEVIAVDAATTATVQEVHLAAIHLLCDAIDTGLAAAVPRVIEVDR